MIAQEDKRVRRTKKLLRQALTRLMQQKEFQSITVTDVVREADINRGTFYAHYRDIYDLREKIESEMIDDFCAMLDDIHPNTVPLYPVLSRAVKYLRENQEIVIGLIGVSGADGFGKKMIHVIEEYLEESAHNHGLETQYAARFIATGVVGVLKKWISEANPLPGEEMTALLERILAPFLGEAKDISSISFFTPPSGTAAPK